MYLAQRRVVQTFLKSGGILVGAFVLGFVVQSSFGVAEFLQASLPNQATGGVQSMLASSIQCANVTKSDVPIVGGSGEYSIALDRPELGNFFIGSSTVPVAMPFTYSSSQGTLIFQGNTVGTIGTGTLTIHDTSSNTDATAPISVGYPCIETVRLCAGITSATSTTPASCTPFTATNLTTKVGDRVKIPYIGIVLSGTGDEASRTKFEALPLPGIGFVVQNSVVSGAPAGVVDLGYFYPSGVGTVGVSAEIKNPNAYLASGSRYSEMLPFSVEAVNCQNENNDIFTSAVPLIIPNDFKSTDLPTAASASYPFSINDAVRMEGYTLANAHYTFTFAPSTSTSESSKTVVDQGDFHSFQLFYTGSTAEEQLRSILLAYALLPPEKQVLRIEYSGTTLKMTSKDLGVSAKYTAGNTWTMNGVTAGGTPVSSATSTRAANCTSITGTCTSTIGSIANTRQPFPTTLVAGETFLAYYPGGNGNAFWGAAVQDGSISLEPVPGAPVSFATSAIAQAAAQASTPIATPSLDDCIKATRAGIAWPGCPKTTTTTSSKTPTLLECLQSQSYGMLLAGCTQSTTTPSSSQTSTPSTNSTTSTANPYTGAQGANGVILAANGNQFLQSYDYSFAIIKAIKPGSAALLAQGLGCSASKQITVLADQVEVLAQAANEVQAQTVSNSQLTLPVNTILTLTARFSGTKQLIADGDIEWVITDDMGGSIMEQQKTVTGVDANKNPTYQISNSFKTLQRGTAVIRAKIRSTASSSSNTTAATSSNATKTITPVVPTATTSTGGFIFSKPITITVQQGLEVNGKAYDFTSELFPSGPSKTFTASGLPDFSHFTWITDDITHGTFVVNASTNNILIYTPPQDDSSAKLYIDNIRGIDRTSNQAVNIAVHVRPAKIVNQFIADSSLAPPIVNFPFTVLQDSNVFVKNLQFLQLPNTNGSMKIGTCTVSFTYSTAGAEDTNCADGTALIPWLISPPAMTAVVAKLATITSPSFTLIANGDTLIVKSAQYWSSDTQGLGVNASVNASDTPNLVKYIAQWTPDTNQILAGDTVKITLNGETISTPVLTATDPTARQTEIIKALTAAKIIAGGEFNQVTFAAADTAGNLVTEASIAGSTASLRSMAVSSNTVGASVSLFATSTKPQGPISLKLGRSANLKIVALLEDGRLVEWRNSAASLNPRIFGNPVWSDGSGSSVASVQTGSTAATGTSGTTGTAASGTTTGGARTSTTAATAAQSSAVTVSNAGSNGVINVQSGLVTAQKVGRTTLSLVTTSRWYELASSVADKTAAGTVQWVERVENNPSVVIPIEVTPAFKVNNSARSNINDAEDMLKMVAKSGDTIPLTVTDIESGTNIVWSILQNQSGIAPTVTGNNFTYSPGPKSDAANAVTDILRVSDGIVYYNIAVSVNPAVLQSLALTRTNAATVDVVHADESIPLTLQYQLAGSSAAQTINFADTTGTVPAILTGLTWTSSDEKVVHVADGKAIALAEGVATITVSSALDNKVKSSLIITVDGAQAKFIAGSTKITPAFPAIDAMIHIETIVYAKAGIDNIQEVSIKFNSPYLADGILKRDDKYLDEMASRTGVPATVTPVTGTPAGTAAATGTASGTGTTATATAGTATAAATATQPTSRQARYMLDYQLPGEKLLEGKTVTYVLTVTTKQGIRTDTTAAVGGVQTTPLASGTVLQNSISQAGVLSIGSANNICNNRLICLVRGLQCLAQKNSNTLTEECDQIIWVFTQTPAEFSIIDVIKKYRSVGQN